MSIVEAVQIMHMKKQARKHYIAYCLAIERLDCGAHLAKIISTDVAASANAFNGVMDQIAKIDPTAPKTRL